MPFRRPFAAAAIVAAVAAAGLAQQPPPAPRSGPIAVLYLEQQPRWEWRSVQRLLQRAPDIKVALHLGVDQGQQQEPPFVAWPVRREEFDAYDVILVGDVTLEGDAAQRQDWMLELMGFLDRGRGVAFLAGNRMPTGHRGTILEKLLPVRLLPERGHPGREPVTARLVPPAGADHPILRIDVEGADVFSALPRLHYRPFAQDLVPGAQALLVDREHPIDGHDAVVVAAGSFGKGRTVFVGTDETWVWRDPSGDRHQEAFWQRLVRFLAGRLE